MVLILGALVPMGRVMLDPIGSLPGSELSDVYKHAWGYWHTLLQISEGTFPETHYLNYPDGGVLLDVMLIPSLIMAPVTLLAGPVLACNLWVFFSIGAIGAATYLLSRYLVGSVVGSLCAGLLVQSTPFLLGHALTSGVHERLMVWIFPATLLGLMRIGAAGGWRWPLFLTAGTAATALQCPTYGLFLGVFLFLSTTLTCTRLGRGRGARLPKYRNLAVMYFLLFAILGGCAMVYNKFVLNPRWLASIPVQRVMPSIGVTSPRFDVASLDSLFNPLAAQREQPSLTDDELWLFVYVGVIPALAMMAGMAVAWRRRNLRLVAALGLAFVFGVLSLGPKVDLGGTVVTNPIFYFISYVVPFYGGAQPVWQQTGVLMGVGMIGVASLVGAIQGRRRRWAVALLLLVASIGERVWALPVPVMLKRADARVSAVYAKTVGVGGLVNIPRIRPDTILSVGEIFVHQTEHKHPIPLGINLGRGQFEQYSPVMDGVTGDWGQAAYCLKMRGYRWLVVDREMMAAVGRAKACLEGLSKAAGPPVADDGEKVLFDLKRANSKGRTSKHCR